MAVPRANRSRIPQHSPLKERATDDFKEAPPSEFTEPPPAAVNTRFFMGFMIALAALVVLLLGLKK